MLFQFLFGSGRKRKTSRSARVRKLSNKVAKLKRNASLKAKEEKLRNDLNKLRGY